MDDEKVDAKSRLPDGDVDDSVVESDATSASPEADSSSVKQNADVVHIPRTITFFGAVSFIVGTIIGMSVSLPRIVVYHEELAIMVKLVSYCRLLNRSHLSSLHARAKLCIAKFTSGLNCVRDGSGIFISPRSVAIGSGSVGMTMVSWVLCGVISTLGAFCYAELGTVIKESGADYIYLHYAFGPFFSYLYSWVCNILVKPAALATVLLTCAQYISVAVFTDGCGPGAIFTRKLLAITIIVLLAATNIYSSRISARIQIIFTVAKLLALAVIIVGGIVMLILGNTQYLATGFEGTTTNPGTIAVGLYAGLGAYDGWSTANFITEELINPERNLPLAILVAMPLVIVVYTLTNLSYFTVMSIDELINSSAVGLTWAERVIPGAEWLIPIFVAMSTFGTGNGITYSSGRLVQVAARNDHLPSALAMINVFKLTPLPAIVVQTILAVIFVIPGNIGSLLDFTNFLLWIFYALNILAVLVLRYRKNFKDAHRVVRTPLIVIILAFVAALFLIFVPLFLDPRIEQLFAVVLIAVGILFWIPFVYFKRQLFFMDSFTKFVQLYTQVVRPQYETSLEQQPTADDGGSSKPHEA